MKNLIHSKTRFLFCFLDDDDSDEYTTEEEETDHGEISDWITVRADPYPYTVKNQRQINVTWLYSAWYTTVRNHLRTVQDVLDSTASHIIRLLLLLTVLWIRILLSPIKNSKKNLDS